MTGCSLAIAAAAACNGQRAQCAKQSVVHLPLNSFPINICFS